MKKKKKTKDEILKAAGTLLAQRGYFGVSMRDIAYELDLTKAALYYHFKSKNELCLNLLSSTANDLTNNLSLAFNEGKDPLDKLFSVIKAYLDFATKRPEARLLLNQELANIEDEGLRDLAENFERQILKFLGKTISTVEQTKCWSKRKVFLVASFILSFVSQQFLIPYQKTFEASKTLLSLIFPTAGETKA